MSALLINVGLAFVAGALLNFTPCVLPVIPFKIRALIREVGGEASHRLFAALAFLAGTLAFFLALGAATAWMGLVWGALFQSKVFLGFLASFLAVSAVATFADWTFNLPQLFYSMPGHRYVGAFVTGAVAGVLSTPCAGPFLGGVLAYAFTQPPVVILALFGAIGAGLAFPYLVILAWPKLLDHLAATRPWAGQVKGLLGFALLAAAVFFALPLLPKAAHTPLWYAVATAFVGWSVQAVVKSKGQGWVAKLLPIGALAGVALAVVMLREPAEGLKWREYTEQAKAQAYSEGKAVLIDFTADWCLNCKAIERTVFHDQNVIDAMGRTGTYPLVVDMTNADEAKQKILESHGGTALPYFVLLDRKGEQAAAFSGLFDSKQFLQALGLATK